MKYKLGEIAEFINGDRGKNYPSAEEINNNGDVPFVNAGLLENSKINFNNMNYISFNKYNSLNSGKFKENDILYCLRGSLGKKALVKKSEFGAIASSLVIIRPNNELISSKYLLFALDSSSIKQQEDKVCNGSTQPNLSATNVKQYFIEVPSLSDQHKIVATLDQVNDLISIKNQQLEQLDLLVKSRFVEMFGDIYSNKNNYEIKKLKDLSIKISDGVHAKPDYTAFGRPFLSVVNINKKKIDFTDCKYVSEEAYQKMIRIINTIKIKKNIIMNLICEDSEITRVLRFSAAGGCMTRIDFV